MTAARLESKRQDSPRPALPGVGTETRTGKSLTDFKSCPRDFLIKLRLQIDQTIFKN